jgi:tetrahydromethanopterin S-methyltransferase subunit G
MSEEQTDRLEGGTPFEIRVLRELSNLNSRLTSLEEKVDARLHDTRPIWEAVLSRLDSIEAKLDRMEAKLNVFSKDLIETRTDVEILKERPRRSEV